MSTPRRFDDVTCILRECGERTADASAALIENLLGETVHRVSARPFSEALRQSMELGVALGRPWTLFIDADVLILPALADFIEQARRLPMDTFEMQALVIDKLLPSRRPAGNHLYRTTLLNRALPLIPANGSLRPENDVILAMATRGHCYQQSPLVVGVHDFEQDYSDIYKKAFLHGHKHDYLIPLFRPIWESASHRDDDFRVALAALDSSSKNRAPPDISRDFMDSESQATIDNLDLRPKPSLAPLDISTVVELAGNHSALHDEVQPLADQIQRGIDAVLFPSQRASVGWLDSGTSFIRRAKTRLASIFGQQ